MAHLKKIIITPWFGPLPPWFEQFKENFEATLRTQGYDWLMETDLEAFKKRVKDRLGIDYPGLPGTGKVWDYRGALGYLFQEEIKDYDFWGHMDFDMCFGDVSKWFPDEELEKLDIWSNHNTYICGPWTLYRNKPEVNELFKRGDWEHYMSSPEPNGWVEGEFSRIVEGSGLRYRYSFEQGNPYTENPNLQIKYMEERLGMKLYQDGVEIPMFHFRRSKTWPLR